MELIKKINKLKYLIKFRQVFFKYTNIFDPHFRMTDEAELERELIKEIANQMDIKEFLNLVSLEKKIKLHSSMYSNSVTDEQTRHEFYARDISRGQNEIVYNFIDIMKRQTDKVTLLDIGANKGWFTDLVLKSDFSPSKIIMFEPLQSLQNELSAIVEKSNARCSIELRKKALLDSIGNIAINEISKENGLSSVLEIEDDYKYFNADFDQSIVNKENIESTTLDEEFDSSQSRIFFVKLDTQGTELSILKGAKNMLNKNKIKGLLIELSTISKYKGSHLYHSIDEFMRSHDFFLYDINPFYREKNGAFQVWKSGHLTEYDAIYLHKENLKYVK